MLVVLSGKYKTEARFTYSIEKGPGQNKLIWANLHAHETATTQQNLRTKLNSSMAAERALK